MHLTCHPSILYLGTPVVLVGTCNEDGSANLAPMSSVFWLGWRCVMGWGVTSKTAANMLRTGECTISLPHAGLVHKVDRLALTTGVKDVPPHKQLRGYSHVRDKFAHAGLTAHASTTVKPPCVRECQVQLEAVVEGHYELGRIEEQRGNFVAFELRVTQVRAHEQIMQSDRADHIDPDKWRPLIMSFQQFYGLGPRLQKSTLASIPEALYKSADLDRAREAGSTALCAAGLQDQAAPAPETSLVMKTLFGSGR